MPDVCFWLWRDSVSPPLSILINWGSLWKYQGSVLTGNELSRQDSKTVSSNPFLFAESQTFKTLQVRLIDPPHTVFFQQLKFNLE